MYRCIKYVFCISYIYIYIVQNDAEDKDINILNCLNKLLRFNVVYDINENKFDFNGCTLDLDISFLRPRSCHSKLFVIPSRCIESRTCVHR